MAEQVRLQINLQKGKSVETTALINADSIEKDGIRTALTEHAVAGCGIGRIQLQICKEALSEPSNLSMETPIRICLPVEDRPEKSRQGSSIRHFSCQ